MLLQDRKLYTITGVEGDSSSKAHVSIRINPECDVFNGHFPGYPVVPGVCSLETVKECAETILGRRTFMRKIAQCRYRNIIEPSKVNEVSLDIVFSDKENGKEISAVLFQDDKVFMELKAELAYV